jgi:hypothetical protein
MASQTVHPFESAVHGDQGGIETFGEGDIDSVPSPDVESELPSTRQEAPMAVALSWPVAQILDRLLGCSCVEVAGEELATHDTQHLDIDDVGRCLIRVFDEALSDERSSSRSHQHLEKTRGVNDEHSIRPRTSLLVQCTEDVQRRDGARPARGSCQPFTDGRSSGDAGRRLTQEFWNGHPRFAGVALKGRVDVVVYVADLHCFRHTCMLSCNLAWRCQSQLGWPSSNWKGPIGFENIVLTSNTVVTKNRWINGQFVGRARGAARRVSRTMGMRSGSPATNTSRRKGDGRR